ncbi:MAG: bifunctional UDP-N-acetylglucosamine diphosphorylase/glucosamine-1-phosphate N-acetyltransferase GlmU [Phascolarctobacterium sp.]|nr:bifunctional UDP-N-acetylglucosamine diphosphorylase/glucosamine-1-phosphate N-acetyltransferase GlmU [Phascolarctobacterium sp.]
MDVTALILAAGKGTRMKSKLPKVLHKVCGKPMLQHVLDAAEAAGAARKIVVVGHEAPLVEEAVGERAEIVLQAEQNGTGHAVMQAEGALKKFKGTVLILCGDTPLLSGKELKKFCEGHEKSGAEASVLTASMDDPTGYGRIICDSKGFLKAIVEEKDATEKEKKVREINTGIYCVSCQALFKSLKTITKNNVQGEYYLTDIFGKMEKVRAMETRDAQMIVGINSRKQLAEAESAMKTRILEKFMDDGVTIMDPASTFIESSVKIAPDTTIYPYTWLEGETEIGTGSEIGPSVRLSNVKVGEGAKLSFLYGHECTVGNCVTAGPYVHLRPDTVIGDDVKIGDFVEVKNSIVGKGSKLPHLSYIGDTDMGEDINIGCGTVVVNYDGKTKHRTVIGDGAFIGCNANLVAPVTVKNGAFVAAGSTITKEVPEEGLAVARARQKNIKGWAKKYRKK